MTESKKINNATLYYTCENCGGTFEKGQSDDEARAEFKKAFPNHNFNDDTALVCDDCYEKIMTWLKDKK